MIDKDTSVTLWIEERIIQILVVYPKLSPTMLQMAMGPTVPASCWRPVLQRLIDEGVIHAYNMQPSFNVESKVQHKRTRAYPILELSNPDKHTIPQQNQNNQNQNQNNQCSGSPIAIPEQNQLSKVITFA
jgi:hypothetical protein